MTDAVKSIPELVTARLQEAVGKPLLTVSYFVLWNDFDAEHPNESGGCELVVLDFDGVEIEVDWGSEDALLIPGVTHHIQTRDYKRRRDPAREWSDDDISGLNGIVVSWKPVWRCFLGKPLEGFEVLGRSDGRAFSPQAIRLQFPGGSMVIAIGRHDGDVVIVGDGDELLIFPAAQWPAAAGNVRFLDSCLSHFVQ